VLDDALRLVVLMAFYLSSRQQRPIIMMKNMANKRILLAKIWSPRRRCCYQ